jgi:hypothetical protein
VAIREITTEWTLPSGSGHLSVMYFDAGVAVAAQRTALHTFWTSVKALQSTTTVYNISGAGRELDEASGLLTGSWTESSVKNGAGGSGSVSVPDAVQALIQWRTVTITNGRFLRGRTFVPGLGIGQTSGGNVIGTAVTTLQTAANALIASGAALDVWHRPVAGSGGAKDAVSTASIWTEFAVLRRRRG